MPDNEEKLCSAAVGSRLMRIRKQLGITQAQAARAAGLTQSGISDIENAKRSCSLYPVLKLIRFYNVPYESVFGEAAGTADENSTLPPLPYETERAAKLLFSLISGGKSEELTYVCSRTLTLGLYFVFRKVYRQNPHNFDRLFRISYEEAERLAERYAPKNVLDEIELCFERCRIDKKGLELPVEDNPELIAFISSCEKMLLSITV